MESLGNINLDDSGGSLLCAAGRAGHAAFESIVIEVGLRWSESPALDAGAAFCSSAELCVTAEQQACVSFEGVGSDTCRDFVCVGLLYGVLGLARFTAHYSKPDLNVR